MISSSIFTLCIIALFISVVYTGSVYAQNQTQNQSSSQNETMAIVTDKPQTVLANQTTVPAEQTTVTVNQTTKPIQDQSQLQPLENQTISAQAGNLSNIENKTMVQATGPATTIIANKTTVPFNQTTIGMGNMTNSQSLSAGQQQPQQQQNQTGQGQQQPQQQQNQSQGPLEQLGESLNNMIGGGN
ncbi:MAG TPA: hypothetical protein VD815_04870 [Candidatus Saccharimonadales bacterium]|nr:hypothetical protein [Candidatus Saccharimonadales bacterium]